MPGQGADFRYKLADQTLNDPKFYSGAGGEKGDKDGKAIKEAQELWKAYNEANTALKKGNKDGFQAGNTGVNLSVASNFLRQQTQLTSRNRTKIAKRDGIGSGLIVSGHERCLFDPSLSARTLEVLPRRNR